MRERFRQLRMAFEQTRQVDDRLVPWMLGVAFAVLAVSVVVGVLTGATIVWTVLGVVLAMLAAMSVFGRRAQRAQLTAIEGQPGAAAAVLNVMRGQWFVTPAVAVTRKQELVHRAVGRQGIVLVGEGDSRSRVEQLLGQERKRHERAAGSGVPVHTVLIGDGEGEHVVTLQKLQMHVQRLPRELSKTEVPKLERKLAALNKGNIPMPQGYIPKPGKKQR